MCGADSLCCCVADGNDGVAEKLAKEAALAQQRSREENRKALADDTRFSKKLELRRLEMMKEVKFRSKH